METMMQAVRTPDERFDHLPDFRFYRIT